MGKNPAFQFYPGDWIREPGLRTSDIITRGCWIECLVTMHDAEPRGVLQYSVLEFSRLWRVHPKIACHAIWELDSLKIADVEFYDDETKKKITDYALDWGFSRTLEEEENDEPRMMGLVGEDNGDFSVGQNSFSSLCVTITSRRMLKEYLAKETEMLRGRVRRQNKPIQEKSTENPRKSTCSSSSSSSSSSISISKKQKNLWSSDDDRDGFNSFWKEYPKKVQKQTAIKAWKKLKPTDGFHTLLETILKDVRSRANSDEWTKDNLQFCPYPASYLNGRRWEDEVPPPRDPMGFLKFAKPDTDEEDEPGYNPEFRAPRMGDKP